MKTLTLTFALLISILSWSQQWTDQDEAQCDVANWVNDQLQSDEDCVIVLLLRSDEKGSVKVAYNKTQTTTSNIDLIKKAMKMQLNTVMEPNQSMQVRLVVRAN